MDARIMSCRVCPYVPMPSEVHASADYIHQCVPILTCGAHKRDRITPATCLTLGCPPHVGPVSTTDSKRPRRDFEAEGWTERILGLPPNTATETRTRLLSTSFRSDEDGREAGTVGRCRQPDDDPPQQRRWQCVPSSQPIFLKCGGRGFATRRWRGRRVLLGPEGLPRRDCAGRRRVHGTRITDPTLVYGGQIHKVAGQELGDGGSESQ